MFKRYLKSVFILLIIMNITGCAELRRKFIRKKKPTKEEHSFYRVEEYGLAPVDERYHDHYVFWRNWQLDLERMEGTSHKRDITAVNESLRHLTEMRDMLMEEKAAELNIQIKKMEALAAELKTRRIDFTKDMRSRRTIERTGRVIVNNFSYNRMKDHLIRDNQEKSVEESEE